MKQLNEELKQRAHKIAKIKADAEAQAKKFEGASLTIKAKVSEGKNIYGSVGAKEIAAALAAQGLEIDSKLITVKAAKALGNYEATAHFHREVSVVIPFEVVNENGEVPAKEEAPKVESAEEPAPAEEPVAETSAE